MSQPPALGTLKPFVPDLRQPLARQLYQLLLERICRFELEPGQLISEASLSATLGVSRTPVREAVARLAEQGLVEVLPQRGSRVLPLRRSDLEKSQFMREALETAMLRKVMAIPERHFLLMQLDKEITLQRTYLQVGDLERFYQSDEDFHRHIAMFAACGPIIEEIARVKVHMDRFRQLTVSSVEDLAMVITQHQAIRQTIAGTDSAAAEACLQQHLRRIFSFLEQAQGLFPQYFAEAQP
ncbi:GntR family transcriptional regulator [Aquitalea sp. ASV15]|uniref:GntR family transcriptional regulator n=1 Tax=Aquitalea sp. ASV15 TaxID=2795104 RepID=UPI0018EC3CF5|nr:GntR family transcriptional regulator [Aquitalea sp. ASV15]